MRAKQFFSILLCILMLGSVFPVSAFAEEDPCAGGHDYVSELIEPSCTTAGYTTYTCSRCGESYVEEGEGTLGHAYVSELTVPPTQDSEGIMTWSCSRCGDSYTESVPKLSPDLETPTEIFSVFFELCGHGDEITSITAETGSLLVRPDDPQADGYVFQGWYHDAGYEAAWDFDQDTVTEETTLFACWVEAAPALMLGSVMVDEPIINPSQGYTLTLNPNYSGALVGMYENVTSMELPSLTRSDYLFLGWSETSTGSVAYRAGDTITLTSNKTLYAVWGIGTLIGGIPVSNGGYVYLGGIRWRVIGVDSGKWLLISADVLGGYKTWGDANSYCGTVFNGFTSPERNVVLSTTKTDDAAYDIYAASNLSDAKLFLLSASEAVTYFSSDADRQPGWWWLRSLRDDDDSSAGCVHGDGNLSDFHVYHDDIFGARPAFQLNLASVLFESAAEGGKSTAAAGGGEFGNFQASSTNGRKLTLIDSSRSGFSANVAGVSSATVTPGGTLAITYSGANTGTNEYVSAMLAVGDNTYYASLTSAGSGTWNLTLPADLTVGSSYTLKVFGEQQNGDTLTDYASSPVEIMLTVSDTVPTTYTVTVNNGTGGGDYAEGASVTITANEPETGMEFKGWTGADGLTFTEGSATASTATFTMPAQAVTVTATYDDIPVTTYTVTYVVVNGTWADGTATDKTEEVEDGQSPAQIPTGMIASEGFEGGAWDTDPATATITGTTTFTYTFTEKQPPTPVTKHTVTYIVVNGTWADGTTADKTEEVEDGQSPAQIPTGMIASEGFEGGAWNVDPNGATITGTTTFTYTFTAKQPPTPVTKYTVTYIVVNGTWADGTATNKTEEVEDGQSPAQIPTGMIASEGFEGGAWNTDPNGATITGTTTFTYTFTAKQPPQPSTISYTAKDGSGNTIQSVTWQKGSGKDLDLTFKRSEDDHLTYGLFGSLEIDGVMVGSAYYGAAEGSLRLSIKPEYLETLSVGDHTIKVNFQDGSTTVKLTVTAAATNPDTSANDVTSPKTGDESNLALWSSLMFLSLAGLLVVVVTAKCRRKER